MSDKALSVFDCWFLDNSGRDQRRWFRITLGLDPSPLKRGIMKVAIRGMQLVGKAPFVNAINIADLEKAIVSHGFQLIESGNFPDSSPPARYLVARKC